MAPRQASAPTPTPMPAQLFGGPGGQARRRTPWLDAPPEYVLRLPRTKTHANRAGGPAVSQCPPPPMVEAVNTPGTIGFRNEVPHQPRAKLPMRWLCTRSDARCFATLAHCSSSFRVPRAPWDLPAGRSVSLHTQDTQAISQTP